MKYRRSKITFLCLALLLTFKLQAQEIKNMMVSPSDKTIEVYYDLEGAHEYVVQLFYSNDDGKTWSGPLKMVTGDVGHGQLYGRAKKIIWNAASEINTMEGYFQFKILAIKDDPDSAYPTVHAKDQIKSNSKSMYDIKKNSIYMEMICICYDRVFPAGDKFGIALTVGGTIVTKGWFLAEATTLFGGPKHMFEPGFGLIKISYNDVELAPIYKVGYRFQGKRGLLFKSAVVGLFYGPPIPFLSIGYSF